LYHLKLNHLLLVSGGEAGGQPAATLGGHVDEGGAERVAEGPGGGHLLGLLAGGQDDSVGALAELTHHLQVVRFNEYLDTLRGKSSLSSSKKITNWVL
jgi:hypothetical protein